MHLRPVVLYIAVALSVAGVRVATGEAAAASQASSAASASPLKRAAGKAAQDLAQARTALTGQKKNTALARKLLLDVVATQIATLPPGDRCYVYVYLGYIEDLSGNRPVAIAWYKKAVALTGQDIDAIRDVAKEGLAAPVTWIRHLDATEDQKRNPSGPAQSLEQARKALTGQKKDAAAARKILLDLAENQASTLTAGDRCYVYVYLGYIEDLAGDREAAVTWYKKATGLVGPDVDKVRDVATEGLSKPITWIRHLDEPGKASR